MVHVGHIAMVIAHVRTLGMVPTELHVNPADFKHFEEAAGVTQKVLTPFQRLVRLLKRDKQIQAVRVCDLPVVANPAVLKESLAVRMQHQMSNPNWLGETMTGVTAEVDQASKTLTTKPAVEPTLEVSPVEDDELHLTCQKYSDGRPTCSAILVSAMENIDDYESIIILRVGRNQQVSMLKNIPAIYAFGVLHSALSRMAE